MSEYNWGQFSKRVSNVVKVFNKYWEVVSYLGDRYPVAPKEVEKLMASGRFQTESDAKQYSRRNIKVILAILPVPIALATISAIVSPPQPVQKQDVAASPSPSAIASPSPDPSPSQAPQIVLSKDCPVIIHGNIAGGKAFEVLQSDGTQAYWVMLTSDSQQNIFRSKGFIPISYESFIDSGISLEAFASIRKAVFSAYGGSGNVEFVAANQNSVLNASPFFGGKSCL